MSASPQTSQAVKRPLEDASSPSRNDQPEAKRPALDKIVKDAHEIATEGPEHDGDTKSETPVDDTAATNGNHENDGNHAAKLENGYAEGEHGDTAVHDAPAENKIAIVSGPTSMSSNTAPPHVKTDETAWLHIRATISSPEAATIIGKSGENVQKIRQMSNAKCTISEYQKGAVERILTVSGVVDAVAKAFGLIVRTLCNEPLDQPSNGLSKTYPFRLLIPAQLIGSIIGRSGSRIKEIQEASGAKLNASDYPLSGSTERQLLIMGVADAIHIATYYVGSTLLEQLNKNWGGPAASAYATRNGGPAGGVPGGLNVVPYVPQTSHGNYGSRDQYHRGMRHDHRAQHHMPPHQPYNQQYPHPHQAQPGPAMPTQYGGQSAGGYAGAGPHMPQHHGAHAGPQAHATGPHGQPIPAGGAGPGAPLTQQIFIPNDMVGAIIGKGGQKINEIRQVSGSVIKINEPQDNSNERLVTITGTEECNRMALYMLYSRLESEKHRI